MYEYNVQSALESTQYIFVYKECNQSKVQPHFDQYPFTPQILILTHQQQIASENIAGKEEIARNEQFLLFPQCFLLNQKIVSLLVNIYDIISLFVAELEEPKIGM